MLSVDNGLCIGDFLWPFVLPKNNAARHIRISATRQCHAPISAVLAENSAVLARFSASTAENRTSTAGFTQTAHTFLHTYTKNPEAYASGFSLLVHKDSNLD